MITYVASSSHIILIVLTFIYYQFKPGLTEFRPKEEDIKENGELKDNIINSTGYKDWGTWIEARRIAQNALKDYRIYWLLLLGCWFSLYSIFILPLFSNSIQSICLVVNNTEIVISTINNFNTLLLLICFYILNESITDEFKETQGSILNLKDKQNVLGRFIWGAVIVFLGFITEIILCDWYPTNVKDIHKGFKIVSGVLGALALARFVAQFLNKFVKSPSWLITTLFLYTSIQPLFVFFGENTYKEIIIQAIVINLALLLKCLLILYMFWLFHSGRLLFYLVRVRRTHQQVDSEWQKFREVLKNNNK